MYELLDELIALLKTLLPEAKEVRMYKGEFMPDTDWSPVFPIVFVQSTNVLAKMKGQIASSFGYTVNVYIGVKNDVPSNKEFFDKAMKVLNELPMNGNTNLTQVFNISLNSAVLEGYFFGIDAWRVELSVGKNAVLSSAE